MPTPTTDDLTALSRAWLDGDLAAGRALHDALEEWGWPLVWHRGQPDHSRLRTPSGHTLAGITREHSRSGKWVAYVAEIGGAGEYWNREAAAAAAEAALRRALRGA